jgi:hypothetical protein
MAWSLSAHYDGHLCKRRRGGGAEHRIQDVVMIDTKFGNKNVDHSARLFARWIVSDQLTEVRLKEEREGGAM